MPIIIELFALAFLQILICRNTKKQFGLILPVLCAIASFTIIGPALMNDISVSEPLILLLALFNDYTIDFVLLLIIYMIYAGNSEPSEQTPASVAAETKTFEQTVLTEASSVKEENHSQETTAVDMVLDQLNSKSIKAEIKESASDTLAIFIMFVIGAVLILSLITFFILFVSLG